MINVHSEKIGGSKGRGGYMENVRFRFKKTPSSPKISAYITGTSYTLKDFRLKLMGLIK